jgi:hypothetical protein
MLKKFPEVFSYIPMSLLYNISQISPERMYSLFHCQVVSFSTKNAVLREVLQNYSDFLLIIFQICQRINDY